MTHCPRPNCGGSLVADFDNGLVCMSCGRSPEPVRLPESIMPGQYAHLRAPARGGHKRGTPHNFPKGSVLVDGKRLRELRKERRWTLTELARLSDIASSTIQRYEVTTVRTSELLVGQLAVVFGVDVAELMANTPADHGD